MEHLIVDSAGWDLTATLVEHVIATLDEPQSRRQPAMVKVPTDAPENTASSLTSY